MTADAFASQQRGDQEPPRAKGGLPWLGHMLSFVSNPYRFVEKIATESGEIVSFQLMGQKIVLLTGDEASELFYRSSDDELDQSAAYKLMTPIFGEGLVFDAPIDRKNEQLKMLMPSLQIDAMRQHSSKVVLEVEDLIKNWGESGEIELVEFMKQLTINTASHCLLGKEFRYELSEEFAQIYHDLEQGVNPVAYHFPNLPIPKFKKRDAARARLQQLVGQIVRKRKNQTEKPSDMFQTLIDMEYKDGTKLDDNEITGLLVGAIFAGHHTSSGTSAWVLIELLRNPHILRATIQELDDLLGRNGKVTFQSLREMPVLENVLKEVLRLHPPLIILMRQVSKNLHFKNYVINQGEMVWACPPVTHRLSKLFSEPYRFDPDRFSPERKEDKNLMAYQPFGGGKHKCSGNAFAMFQIKAIFATLLRRYEFELIDAPGMYVDNYSEMIVQPKSPCRIRYKLRDPASIDTEFGSQGDTAEQGCPAHSGGAVKPAEAKQSPKSAAKKATKKAPTKKSATSAKRNVSAKPASNSGEAAKVAEKPAKIATAVAGAVSYKVVVDRGLCQGHSVCVGEAEDYFDVDNESVLHLLKENVDPADYERVEKAVSYCPNHALSLEKVENKKTVKTD
ncbi:MAG: cytochrome P450 [Pseudomonadales bacterium]|nr:cytochrome P450 [Pseudomonadales bacterium]